MKKFLDSFSWAFLTLFSIPTILIMASWYSLPGDSLYRVKLALEDSLIFVAPTYAAKGGLQVKYTKRRFTEATKLLQEKESTDGLPYFTAQVNETKDTILGVPDSQSRRQLAYAYIDTLTELQAELEAQKNAYAKIRISRTMAAVPPKKRTNSTPQPPTPNPSPTPRTETEQRPTHPQPQLPTPTPHPNIETVSSIEDDIDQTQTTIKETIIEIEGALDPGSNIVEPVPTATLTPTPTQASESEENGNSNKADSPQMHMRVNNPSPTQVTQETPTPVQPTQTPIPSEAVDPTSTPVDEVPATE